MSEFHAYPIFFQFTQPQLINSTAQINQQYKIKWRY